MEHTKSYLEYKKKANEKFVRYEEGAEMYHEHRDNEKTCFRV